MFNVTHIKTKLHTNNIIQLKTKKEVVKHAQNLEFFKKLLLPHVELLQCRRKVAMFCSFVLHKLQELLAD